MNDVAFADRAAYFEVPDVLVLADLHVGRDESSAVALPIGEREDLHERLASLLERFEPETVVVAGDVVHTFDGVSARSLKTLDRLTETCRDADATLELVAGNHDSALPAAWDGIVHDEYVVGEDTRTPRAVICHGHEPPRRSGDRYVFGHVHPTIEIEGDRRPCFLYGNETYRAGDVLCLPAFTRLAPGVDVGNVATDEFETPLVADANRLEPIVIEPGSGEPLRFPPLGEFRSLL